MGVIDKSYLEKYLCFHCVSIVELKFYIGPN